MGSGSVVSCLDLGQLLHALSSGKGEAAHLSHRLWLGVQSICARAAHHTELTPVPVHVYPLNTNFHHHWSGPNCCHLFSGSLQQPPDGAVPYHCELQ